MSWLETMLEAEERLLEIHNKYSNDGLTYVKKVLGLMEKYQYSKEDILELYKNLKLIK